MDQIAPSHLVLSATALTAALSAVLFLAGRGRALSAAAGQPRSLHSRPNYHGWFVALSAALPAMLVLGLYTMAGERAADELAARRAPQILQTLPSFERDIQIDTARALASGAKGAKAPEGDIGAAVASLSQDMAAQRRTIAAGAAGLACFLAIAVGLFGLVRVRRELRARNAVETVVRAVLFAASGVAIATTVGIVLSLLFETLRFFEEVSPLEFFLGTKWSAQTNIRPDQVGSSGAFGALPLLFGSLMITFIAMLVAGPVGLFSAIFLSEYASPSMRRIVKPVLEVLAGVPTVVYGFFALLTVAPAVKAAGEWLDRMLHVLMPWVQGPIIDAQPTSALAAGLVMGVMIIPFVSSLADDVINAVPQTLRDGSYALGATRSETVRQVVMPAALPGVVAAMLLAVSRAIGETMIVVMAAGQRAQITPNPFQDLTTITVQIVDLLTGDTEFDSPKTLSAFALGFMLFMITLVFNVIAQRVVKAYREKYD